MPDSHAVLSASGAYRWMNCPPSALIEAGMPDESSPAAEQGTVAHALAEWKLQSTLDTDFAGQRPVSDWVDGQMEELTDDYVAFVHEHLSLAREKCADARLLIEQRLDFSHVVPGGFGTGDAVIIAEPRLEIIDLKYGAGVVVDAENNPQLMLYALGALRAFGDLYEISKVALTIYQPRRGNVSTWEVSVHELQAWAEQTVKPVAVKASQGVGEFKSGSWCRFCRLAPTCRARAEANLQLAKHEFKVPPELSDSEIVAVLAQIPQLTKWVSDVEDYALSMAVNRGKCWPGFKLVAGRSIRRYTDTDKVAKTATKAGFNDIYEQKLLGVTAMEKLMGKKTFTQVLGDLVIKPEGKPTLVPQTDKRPAINAADAQTEFTTIKKEEK